MVYEKWDYLEGHPHTWLLKGWTISYGLHCFVLTEPRLVQFHESNCSRAFSRRWFRIIWKECVICSLEKRGVYVLRSKSMLQRQSYSLRFDLQERRPLVGKQWARRGCESHHTHHLEHVLHYPRHHYLPCSFPSRIFKWSKVLLDYSPSSTYWHFLPSFETMFVVPYEKRNVRELNIGCHNENVELTKEHTVGTSRIHLYCVFHFTGQKCRHSFSLLVLRISSAALPTHTHHPLRIVKTLVY